MSSRVAFVFLIMDPSVRLRTRLHEDAEEGSITAAPRLLRTQRHNGAQPRGVQGFDDHCSRPVAQVGRAEARQLPQKAWRQTRVRRGDGGVATMADYFDVIGSLFSIGTAAEEQGLGIISIYLVRSYLLTWTPAAARPTPAAPSSSSRRRRASPST